MTGRVDTEAVERLRELAQAAIDAPLVAEVAEFDNSALDAFGEAVRDQPELFVAIAAGWERRGQALAAATDALEQIADDRGMYAAGIAREAVDALRAVLAGEPAEGNT